MLPGLIMPLGHIGRASTPLTLTRLDATTSSGSRNIVGHPSIQAGDLLVLMDCVLGTSSAVAPSGFTKIVETDDGDSLLSYKIADGSEAGSTIQGMNGQGANFVKIMTVFRPSRPIIAASAGSPRAQSTSGNPAAQTVTSGSGTSPLVVIATYSRWGGSSLSPRTFQPAKDGEISITRNVFGDLFELWKAWKIYNEGAENVTVDMNDHGDYNTLMSCYIEVK